MRLSSCLAVSPFVISTGALAAARPPPPPEPQPLVVEPNLIPEELLEPPSEAPIEKQDADQPTSPNPTVYGPFTTDQKPKADCVLVGGMPVDYTWLGMVWKPRFKHSTYMKKLSVVRPKQCIPIMCARSTGGAYWCNDSDLTKTRLWRELAETAGEVFSQCKFGISSSGQMQFDQDSRIIVTHPLGQGCNMRYDATLETRGPYEGTWPEELEDTYVV
ncbi:hypothetical protein QBC36DRAFT_289870 [Triangularia setosa]|uniref:Uncharacterized protein n=1 Tax=Triangularia setosa TaxID=2587417 RepID=A0AAN6WBK7_9PEZI|nr:hypothetical protein QBC36DRAFT_289870 [Podospora setosa]